MNKFVSKEEGRLDVILSQELNISRAQAQKIIKNGVKVNSKIASKSGYAVFNGDEIEYEEIEIEENKFTPSDIQLDIIYEDEDILVINKPRGLVVHPAPGHHCDTLANGLAYKFNNEELEEDEEFRMGIVHRIDKDTSGLLVVAKNSQSKEFLSNQISQHLVKREYICLATGIFKDQKFRVEAPISRNPFQRKMMSVDVKNGKSAITHFEVIKQFSSLALLKCDLETGRTHQIRVHLSYIKHPIVGDKVYGLKNDFGCKKGQLLHAYKLTLTHPRSLKEMTFLAPLDDYFKESLERLVGTSNIDY